MSLSKNKKDSMQINDENYEDILLSYLDGELEGPELSAMKVFLRAHPERQQELETLRMTILPQEDVRFPGRQSLYRRGKLKWFLLVPAAAAAALLILFLLPSSPSLPPSVRVDASSPRSQAMASPPPGTAKPAPPAVPPAGPAPKRQPGIAAVSGGSVRVPAAVTPVSQTVQRSKGMPARIPENEMAAAKLPPLEQSIQIRIPASAPVALNAPLPAPVPPSPRGQASEAATGQPAVTSIGEAKQAVDHTLTEKITEIQYKMSHPFDLLKGTEIRIGHVSFAFNR
jgi:hypothetical protein